MIETTLMMMVIIIIIDLILLIKMINMRINYLTDIVMEMIDIPKTHTDLDHILEIMKKIDIQIDLILKIGIIKTEIIKFNMLEKMTKEVDLIQVMTIIRKEDIRKKIISQVEEVEVNKNMNTSMLKKMSTKYNSNKISVEDKKNHMKIKLNLIVN